MEQVDQWGGESHIPADTHGQAGPGSKQSDWTVGAPASTAGLHDFKVLKIQAAARQCSQT